jgi:hypothetical protein
VQLQKRINSQHEPPRADKIDGLLDGAVARVRHLHGLLAEWELGTLSAEQSARLLAMIEALRSRLGASLAQLRMWHDGIHTALGPERCQSLFWDLIEPLASHALPPHAFQRAHVADIERRCAQLRVRVALLPGEGGFGPPTPPVIGSAFGSSSATFPSAPPSSAGLGFGVWSAAPPSCAGCGAGSAAHAAAPSALRERAAIDVVIGTAAAADSPAPVRLRVVRCPHAGVSWAQSVKLLAWVDATKQLALSRHAPAFLATSRACRPTPR